MSDSQGHSTKFSKKRKSLVCTGVTLQELAILH